MLDEQEYIRDNFSTLRINYQKYSALNLVIKTKRGRLVRLLFNRVQKRLWQLFLLDLKLEIPIRWYVTKSRQQGSTTWFLGLIYWLLTTQANRNALLLAHDEDAAKSLGVKIQYLHYQSRHKELRPSVRTMNRNQIHFATSLDTMEKTGETGLDCIIDISTGDSDGIGISRTYQYVFITEFGTMPNVGIDVPYMLGQLAQCVAEEPGTGIFIESTAKGENYAKDFWDDEQNGFRKIFITWVAADEYRVDLPFGKYPELSTDPNSQYGDEVEEFAHIKEGLVEWYDEFKLFESDPIANIQLEHEANCRIVWRRRILDTKFFGDYAERRAKFKQEYPTTVYDAYSGSSETIFSMARILEREETIRRLDIRPTHYAFDPQTSRLDRAFYETPHGNLRVFEQPQDGVRYVVGGDAAQGIEGRDESSLIVLRLPELVEVASLNDIIVPSLYAHLAYWLSLLYNKALLAIELNDKGGYAALQILVDMLRYPNLYYAPNQDTRNIVYGYHTNDITKSVAISDAKDLIFYKQTLINSKVLLKQLKTYAEIKPGKYGAIAGKKDDLVSAYLIAVQAAKSIHIPKQFEPPKKPPKGSPAYIVEQMSMRARMRERFRRG